MVPVSADLQRSVRKMPRDRRTFSRTIRRWVSPGGVEADIRMGHGEAENVGLEGRNCTLSTP